MSFESWMLLLPLVRQRTENSLTLWLVKVMTTLKSSCLLCSKSLSQVGLEQYCCVHKRLDDRHPHTVL
jgi:hypothetical protein